jgi:hypothetical protein
VDKRISGNTEYKAEYEYSLGFARKAYLVSLWHGFKGLIIVSLLLVGAGLWGLRSVDARPIAAFLLGSTLVFWFAWLTGFWRAGLSAASFRDPTMRITLTDEACRMQSCFVTSSLRWEGISTVYQRKGVLIVCRRDAPIFTPIPVSALSEDAREFLIRRIREAGGRVC